MIEPTPMAAQAHRAVRVVAVGLDAPDARLQPRESKS